MLPVSQAQSFGDIRIEGQGNTLTINQVVQISVAEVKTRPFIAGSPFVGLRRFEERNKDFFWGRDQLVGRLLQLVSTRNLVLVAGASGSGKSSVVRAGLLPQLGARLPQGCFRELLMTPDRDPFASLRAAFQSAGIAQGKLEALALRTSSGMVQTLRAQRPAEELWLLFIDQFEEIFTLCTESAWREAFLMGLIQLAQTAQNELKIVLAMRADFFDRFGPYPEFSNAMERGLCLVVDMQASELRAAIEQPAARHGVVFEEGLVEQIIADVKGRPGALPLLQYTLDLLWREDNPFDDRTLNAKSYHQIGGIEGALRRRADTIYCFVDTQNQTERAPAQKQAIRQIFLRIVDLTSQGTEGRAVSRRALLSDFPRPEERALIGELVDEKLLVSNAPNTAEEGLYTHGSTVEIAHEALLSAWPKLKGWIEQAREVIYIRNRLCADARHFAEAQARVPTRADDELWGGTRLQQALELRDRGDFTTILGGLTLEEETFLEASRRMREKRAQEGRRARRLLLGSGAGVLLALILGLGFGLREQRLRTRETRQQLLNSYVEQGRQLLFEKQRPGEALLWLHRAQGGYAAHPALPDLLKSAMQSVDATRAVLIGHESPISSAIYSPNGRRIVTTSTNGRAGIWDAASGLRLVAMPIT